MDTLGHIIKSTIGVAVVLTAAFVSQQQHVTNASQGFISPILKKGEAYYQKSPIAHFGDQLQAKLYSNVSGGVKSGEGAVQSTITAKTAAVSSGVNDIKNNSVDAFKKSLAQKMLDALGVKAQDLVPASQCPK